MRRDLVERAQAGDRDAYEQLARAAAPRGTEPHKVYDCATPCGHAGDPAWSSDDAHLAFVSADHVGDGPDSVSHLEVLDLATREARRVLRAPDLAWFFTPRWSPDGGRLVVEATQFATARFDEARATASTVGIVDLEARTPTFEPVLPWGSWATYPDWHPTEDRLVFQLPTSLGDPFAGADLATLALGGSMPTVITGFGPAGWAIQPTWTPDGLRISFVAEDAVRTHPNAATVLANGDDLQRLPLDEMFRTHPRLRPQP